MCGIFGAVSKHALTEGQQQFLRSAMQVGQLRGTHGSGMMTANYTGHVTHAAAAMTGTEFLMSKQFKPVKRVLNHARSAVGHNRHATVGGHTDENCHPFQFDHIVGVHNGSISDAIMRHVDPANSHEVDSGRVFAALSKTDDPLSVLSRLHNGHYSLVWYDTKEKLLRLARNTARPMSLAVTHNGLYFASEMGMLTWLIARHKLDGWHTNPLQFGETDIHKMYSIPLDDLEKVTVDEYKPVPTPTPTPVRGVINQTKEAWKAAKILDAPKDVKKDKQPAKGTKENPAVPRGVADLVASFRDRNKKSPVDLVVPKAPPSNAEQEGTYPYRASRYYTDVDDILKDFPKTKPVVDFIKSNLIYVQGYLYPRAFGSMCTADEGERFTSINGFLTNDIGTKEDKWRALCRMEAPITSEAIINAQMQLPTYDDADGDVMYPIIEGTIFSYELRPTGEIVCIGRPVGEGNPELFVIEEEPNESTWCTYACGEDYLNCLDDAQIADLWLALKSKGLDENDDVPF